MRPKFYAVLSFALLFGVVSTPLPAIAQPSPPLPIESSRVLRQLNLSDSQLLQIRNLREKYQQEMQPLRQQMRQLHQELQAMLSGNASQEQLRSKYQEIGNLRQQISRLQFEQALAMREVLTAEQRNRLAQILQSRRPKFYRTNNGKS